MLSGRGEHPRQLLECTFNLRVVGEVVNHPAEERVRHIVELGSPSFVTGGSPEAHVLRPVTWLGTSQSPLELGGDGIVPGGRPKPVARGGHGTTLSVTRWVTRNRWRDDSTSGGGSSPSVSGEELPEPGHAK